MSAQVVPVVASRKVEAGGFWVLRPDSGDPVEVVLQVRGYVHWPAWLCHIAGCGRCCQLGCIAACCRGMWRALVVWIPAAECCGTTAAN